MSNTNGPDGHHGVPESSGVDATQEIRTSPDRVLPDQSGGHFGAATASGSTGGENFSGAQAGLGQQWSNHATGSAPGGQHPHPDVPGLPPQDPARYAQNPGHLPEPHPGAQPGSPFAPAPPHHAAAAPQSGDVSATSTKKLVGIAATAALLASALTGIATAGMMSASNGGSGGGTGNTTVVEGGSPKDFADAGTVNWSATAAAATPSVVAITVGSGDEPSGQGSGVILDADGNIVTNNHVVAGASRVQVTLSNNKSYDAKVVGKDPSTDLAVIKINGVKDLKPIKMADDSKLVVGQSAMAVGNPLGLSGTVTTGIVSALDRPVTTKEGSDSGDSSSSEPVVTNAIQTSAAINPGNSGGALVNGSGELIGINSSIASLSDGISGSGQSGNIGIGFAIPTSVVKNITNQLIKNGKATHALLGVAASTSQVDQGGAALASAKVQSVSDGGAAEKAGVKEGDQITNIDGEPVTSSNALVGQVRARTPGSKVKLTLVRDGKSQDVTVTLGSKESE